MSSIDPPRSDTETRKRIPIVEFIETDEIRSDVLDVLQDLPPYFWEAPTTTSKAYHNQYTRDRHGLWIHTQMVATALERLLDSHRVPTIEIERMSQREADNLRAAAILHDGLKYGEPPRKPGESSALDHEHRIADLLETRGFDDTAVDAVREHMGPFDRYEGPVPSSPGSWLLHRADMIASNPYIHPAVYKPHEALLEEHTTLPRYSDGDNSVRRSPEDQTSLHDYESD